MAQFSRWITPRQPSVGDGQRDDAKIHVLSVTHSECGHDPRRLIAPKRRDTGA